MATSGLSGQGLRKYQRWLAVQRAKGNEPSPAMMESFLQGEIQANLATETDRQSLSLRREALAGDLETRNRRLDLIEEQQDRQKGADTFRGISEVAKTLGAVNQLTDGGIAKGVSAGWDWATDSFAGDTADTGFSLVDQLASDAGDSIGPDLLEGFEDFSTEILDDVMDWSGLF